MKRAILLLAALLLAALPLFSGALAEAEIGTPVPDFELTCADGTFFRLSAAVEEKPLCVVALFGSGCGACRLELRALELAHRLYPDDVAVIGLSLDRTYDTPETLTQFAADYGLTFPLGQDPARLARFLQIKTYPALMIVNSRMELAYSEVGGEASIDHLVAVFDALLGAEATATDLYCGPAGCALPPEES